MTDRDERIKMLMMEEGCSFEGSEVVVYLHAVTQLNHQGKISEALSAMEEFADRRVRTSVDRLTADLASAHQKIGQLETAIELAKIDARRAATVDRWQPIETAPRDGTRILVCLTGEKPSSVYEAYFNKADGEWWFANLNSDNYYADSITNMMINVPTLWQPMPEPPVP